MKEMHYINIQNIQPYNPNILAGFTPSPSFLAIYKQFGTILAGKNSYLVILFLHSLQITSGYAENTTKIWEECWKNSSILPEYSPFLATIWYFLYLFSPGTIAELMMDQVEYSNVIILNKQDLVSVEQQQDILDRLAVLNPKANIVRTTKGKIDVMEILNTHRFVREETGENSLLRAATRCVKEFSLFWGVPT